jgi:hypothetical protein
MRDTISLKEHLEEKIRFQEKSSLRELIDVKIDSVEKAIKVAKEVLDVRLSSMNEFREQLNDQAKTFFTRSEHEAYLQRVDVLLNNMRETLGKTVSCIEFHAYSNKIEEIIVELRRAKDISEGKATISMVYISYAIGMVSILLNIIMIVMSFMHK